MLFGVSFLATPVKFLVPSLSRPVALEVGRQTFRAFGGVELGLTALLGLRAGPSRPRLAAVPILVVLLQALWLRPRLGLRTDAVRKGDPAAGSPGLHRTYVACEIAKLAALLALGSMPVRSGKTSDAPGRGVHA